MVKNIKLSLIILSFFILTGCTGMGVFRSQNNNPPVRITGFTECAKLYPVLASEPSQCKLPDGTIFVEVASTTLPNPSGSTTPACRDLCGDGTCQQFICLAANCPCHETATNCPADCSGKSEGTTSGEIASSSSDKNGLANPASVNCEKLGGRLEIRNDEQGNQTGFCRLPDGQECEEWALFRNECALSPSSQMGVLSGKVSVGPICPVERVGVPCPVPPEAYTSREIVIYKADGHTEVTRQNFRSDGTYRIDLPPGVYIVNILKSAVGGSKNLPQTVIIEAGKILKLDFSIDTGIR